MKRNDPYTRIQHQQLSTAGITILLLTVVAVFQAFNPRNDLFGKVSFLVPYAMLLIVGVFAILRSQSNLKRLDQLRERALQGNRSLLATEQPPPDPNMLPIPTTIKLDQSRRAVVFLGFVIAFAAFIPLVVGIVVGSGYSHHGPGNDALLLTLLIILGGAVVALLVARCSSFFSCVVN